MLPNIQQYETSLFQTLTLRVDSSNIIMNDSRSTIDLLEHCLPFTEDRYLRCHQGEPWCFLTMYAAILLLKIYLGRETHQSAKTACARRFLDLHFKHTGRQQMSLSHQQGPTSLENTGHIDVSIISVLLPPDMSA